MGNKNANFVSHKKSKLKVDGKPQLPLASALVEGEIAINFAKDVETLSIKNESGDVVTFSSDNYYTEQKLGSGFTGENSAVTVTDVIDEVELVTSSALNDLESRKLDASAYTPTDLTNYYTKSETSGATEISTALSGKLDTTAYTPTEEVWVSGTGTSSVALKGGNNTASGSYSVAEGYSTSATSNYSHAEGYNAVASGNSSHAEGSNTIASGHASHAEGNMTAANGSYSHAEGEGTTASGESSHAEGLDTVAGGDHSHAEGNYTTASGESSHAEGDSTVASGDYSHAEGNESVASGEASHAEGYDTLASDYTCHAEGESTSATNVDSHAEGYATLASGNSSHAEGWGTVALNKAEHASGLYNVSSYSSDTFGDSGNTLFSVGNGTADNTRRNAFEIRQNGDIYITSGNSDIKLQDYIGSVKTVTAITPSNSGSTAPIATKVVAENELVMANALADLNERIGSGGTESGLTETIENMDITFAAALTNLNNRVGIVSAVTVTENLANVTCPDDIVGVSNSGARATVIYRNGGSSAYTIPISTSSGYITQDGNALTLTCPVGGYCKVDYINANGTIYVS